MNHFVGRSRKNLASTGDCDIEIIAAAPSPTPSHHRRSESDPNRGTPNMGDIAAGCDPYMQAQRRGKYPSL